MFTVLDAKYMALNTTTAAHPATMEITCLFLEPISLNCETLFGGAGARVCTKMPMLTLCDGQRTRAICGTEL